MALPGTATSYGRMLDKEGAVTTLSFPSGAARGTSFDAGGRETATDYGPERDVLGYPGADDDADSITRTPDGGTAQALALPRDGFLPKAYEFSGPAAGRYSYTFDDFLDLTEVKLESGGDTVAAGFAYDGDGHATKQGPFTLTRGAPDGDLSALGDGTLSGAFSSYDWGSAGFGKRQLSVSGGVMVYGFNENIHLRLRAARSSRGPSRSARRRATLDLRARRQRPSSTKVQGTAARSSSSYDYDANGNRTSRLVAGGQAGHQHLRRPGPPDTPAAA